MKRKNRKTNVPKRASRGIKRLTIGIRSWLSHHPLLYALIGGTGVVLFWRGIWLTMDALMLTARAATLTHGSIDFSQGLWWDGSLSLVLGSLILLSTSAFVSSLIGNEIIISGLRTEHRYSEKEGKIINVEALEIQDTRRALTNVAAKLDELERDIAAREKN